MLVTVELLGVVELAEGLAGGVLVAVEVGLAVELVTVVEVVEAFPVRVLALELVVGVVLGAVSGVLSVVVFELNTEGMLFGLKVPGIDVVPGKIAVLVIPAGVIPGVLGNVVVLVSPGVPVNVDVLVRLFMLVTLGNVVAIGRLVVVAAPVSAVVPGVPIKLVAPVVPANVVDPVKLFIPVDVEDDNPGIKDDELLNVLFDPNVELLELPKELRVLLNPAPEFNELPLLFEPNELLELDELLLDGVGGEYDEDAVFPNDLREFVGVKDFELFEEGMLGGIDF